MKFVSCDKKMLLVILTGMFAVILGLLIILIVPTLIYKWLCNCPCSPTLQEYQNLNLEESPYRMQVFTLAANTTTQPRLIRDKTFLGFIQVMDGEIIVTVGLHRWHLSNNEYLIFDVSQRHYISAQKNSIILSKLYNRTKTPMIHRLRSAVYWKKDGTQTT